MDQRIRRFRRLLRLWGKTHMRHYPWRYVSDPFAVLVAEFMLHRTQARQVRAIYETFLKHYPTLAAFARGRRSTAAALLRPLGLRWRIEGMLDALTYLWREYRRVPVDYEMLIAVPGVGQYIAGATVCFTQNRPLALIDSNTVRVVGRVFGLDLRGEARRKKPVVEAIAAVCDPRHPRDFYYALIDLAHLICRPAEPKCNECSLLAVPCAYGQARVVADEVRTGRSPETGQ